VPIINFGKREILCKLVYYGPGLGGKTTNLEWLHHALDPDTRGELLNLATETERTIFFDHMPLDLGKIQGFDVRFQLYTVPGQVQYVNSRKAILSGVDGLVFVADSSPTRWAANLESMEDLVVNLTEYDLSLGALPWVIQYNKRDVQDAVPATELDRELNKYQVPAHEAVALAGKGVSDTLRSLSQLVLETFEH
jgi:signal recognition particle receptor subunit beta